MWLFTQEESWNELSSVASLTCFLSGSVAGDSLGQGWRAGLTLETRCHLGLEHQGTQTPHHLPHLMSKSYSRSLGIRTFVKPSYFLKPHLGPSRVPG